MAEQDRLWTPDDLAAFLGYSPSTVIRMASGEPHKLPPRVAQLRKPRWVPEVCREWALGGARSTASAPKAGRPRRVLSPVS